MLGLAWIGTGFMVGGDLERQRWFLWATFCSFPLGFIATLTGWFTAEVGRQPWTIYGQIRTADAVTPFLTTPQVAASLVVFSVVYALIFMAGAVYIYRLLRRGPVQLPSFDEATTNPKRPLSMTGFSPGVRAGAPTAEMGE
jgi:cytochrome d ubiquinol oxidase subunit I